MHPRARARLPTQRGRTGGMRHVAGGSMVVCQGQGREWQRRHGTGMRQVAQLQRSCTLPLEHVEKIKQEFLSGGTAAKAEPNPNISFVRFRRLLYAVGVGSHQLSSSEAETDLFQRLFRVFDRDGNKQVDFSELCEGLSVLLSGSAREKLNMFYDMYTLEAASVDKENQTPIGVVGPHGETAGTHEEGQHGSTTTAAEGAPHPNVAANAQPQDAKAQAERAKAAECEKMQGQLKQRGLSRFNVYRMCVPLLRSRRRSRCCPSRRQVFRLRLVGSHPSPPLSPCRCQVHGAATILRAARVFSQRQPRLHGHSHLAE